MASVRFICGTQDIHRELEQRISDVPRQRGHDPLLVVLRRQRRAFRDAARRGGRDHLRRAQPRLDHRRRAALQGAPAALREPRHGRARAAPARGLGRAPAPDRHRRRVLHGRPRRAAADASASSPSSTTRWSWSTTRTRSGFVGPDGRGTPALHGVAERVDLITGTLGKALGGASGGFTSGRREAIELLRQRSRPYLFSNSLAPPIVAASLAVLDLLEGEGAELRERLFAHTQRFRQRADGARPRRRAGRAPDRAGDVRRRASRRAPPPSACSSTASTPSRSPTRSCRWARRASARSSRPRSPTTTSTAPSRLSPRSPDLSVTGASGWSVASGTACSARSAYSGRLTRIGGQQHALA